MIIKINTKDDSLSFGINEIATYLGITVGDGGYEFDAVQSNGAPLTVTLDNKKGTIGYSEKCHFFRALGLAVEHIAYGEESFSIEEIPQFNMNGPMFDMAQGNAALNYDSLKKLIVQLAIMGLNTLMLYCEDTYEVKEQPYFGYMRPKYLEDELRLLDDYAYKLGIEMIPCIQTLAHMQDALRWKCFHPIRDYEACLLVGKDETYDFVRDLITAASRPFRTKKIHIGMDEAFKLGTGTFLKEYGYKPTIEIMKQHLERVMEIVKEMGLEPMMWDDMFFSTFGTKKYFQPGAIIPQETKDAVPEGMTCVYWDYYRLKQDQYEAAMLTHKQLCDKVIYAGGVWTWKGYSLSWSKTRRATEAALNACKKTGIKNIIMTTWGDNGTECLIPTTYIGCQLFAEHGYSEQIDYDKLAKRFKFVCGGNVSDFALLEYLDRNPQNEQFDDPSNYNASKYLMWQDILTGLADNNIQGYALNDHYSALAEKIKDAVGKNGQFDSVFEFNYKVAYTLALKAEMGLRVTKAYKDGDKELLRALAEKELPELRERVAELWECHRTNWFKFNKPFGWDIMDMRYGSLTARINSAIIQLNQYLNGETQRIEELEQERLPLHGIEGPIRTMNNYGTIVSPSRIDPR